ncbi:hypothetical protein [Aeromonas salmonicida]|uniref:hypothetical protein n=1 Tax=Aeromonas salmonicida TaxID=645 RepID=UPI000F7924D8|nr:hypothetical protein [Aeromonas salmonicida]MCE9971344.1 hypothetical protein [Aeromonas salmonicida]MDM5068163.1 hypothetical protein [Aeromonas salmonicida]MDM5113560.1 hypothetical protein [Aeromonas salmonicida]
MTVNRCMGILLRQVVFWLQDVIICSPLLVAHDNEVARYVTISADLDENPSIQANLADKAFA